MEFRPLEKVARLAGWVQRAFVFRAGAGDAAPGVAQGALTGVLAGQVLQDPADLPGRQPEETTDVGGLDLGEGAVQHVLGATSRYA